MKFINLLLEEDTKLEVIRKSILNKLPLTIQYGGPSPEVKPGLRIDILPVVLGKNAKSGNLVIWAYVFKGVSKKGLPDWKMFRIDRIISARINEKLLSFDLNQIPNYIKDKSPSMMKSLSSVYMYSPYTSINQETQIQNTNEPETKSETKPEINNSEVNNTENTPIVKPELSKTNYAQDIFNELKSKIKDINGKKFISKIDYDISLNNIYHKKEDEFKNYQRMISGNSRPGEGTRQRFRKESQTEFDKILKNNQIEIESENENMLSEVYKKFKHLIK